MYDRPDRDLLDEWQTAMHSVALFERTTQVLREPSRRLASAAGIEPTARRRAEP